MGSKLIQERLKLFIVPLIDSMDIHTPMWPLVSPWFLAFLFPLLSMYTDFSSDHIFHELPFFFL